MSTFGKVEGLQQQYSIYSSGNYVEDLLILQCEAKYAGPFKSTASRCTKLTPFLNYGGFLNVLMLFIKGDSVMLH